MPYIITTSNPTLRAEFEEAGGRGVDLAEAIDAAESCHAVATLHEAREDARNVVEDRAQAPGWTEEYVAWREIARALHEDGDTVGPLPDGTVVEVEHVTWSVLARRGGSWHTTDTPNHVQSYAILDAFNEAD